MTRRKITLAYITNDTERKASFRKRKKGLINKIRELSTLCDVEACAIIYSPYDQEPEVWPTRIRAEAVLARFRSLPEMDRTRKMVNQEGFTRLRIKKARVQLVRLQKDSKRREMKRFLFKCFHKQATLDDFDMRNSAEMGWVINQTLRELTSRMEALKINGRQDASTSGTSAVVARVPPPPGGDDSLEGFMLELVQSPIRAVGRSSGLGWDISELPYPYIFDDSNDQRESRSRAQI